METQSKKITSTVAVFPILKGMTPKVIDFADELSGPRLKEHEASRRHLGFTAERAWIEPTAEGDLLVFYFEGPDIERSFMAIGESDELHDVWFREKMYVLTGADLCDIRHLRAATLLFDSPVSAKAGIMPSVAVFPILPGRTDELKRWLTDLAVMRGGDYLDYLQRYGLMRERYFFLPASGREAVRHKVAGLHVDMAPEDGRALTKDVVILYAEGDDPAATIAKFARSPHPFDAWMREELLYFCGIDFIRRNTAPPARLLLSWVSHRKAEAA